MITLSSHILDTTLGKPAAGIRIQLIDDEQHSFEGLTDQDGRCKHWQGIQINAGTYSLRFHCQSYLMEKHGESFYPFVDITFNVAENGGHYHVPLLISPYSFSSYRGS